MSITFVIARYQEDLAWIDELPADATVYVYNKGPALDPAAFSRPVRLKQLKNAGRESGTYLHYLLHDVVPGESDFTVFTQGGPFEHAPDFLELVRETDRWRPVQPLSIMWVAERKIPPMKVLEDERDDWIGALAVRTEHFSLRTWAPVGFFDEGAWGIGAAYRQKHLLPAGSNIAAHFLEFAGLDELARAAQAAELGSFSYGAIFGVESARVVRLVAEARRQLEALELLSRADLNYGYIFERLWLHLFGEPFGRYAPAVEEAPAFADGPSRPSAREQGRISELRQRAFALLGQGHAAEGITMLQGALALDPLDHEVLADLAALAFQQGVPDAAIRYARRALAALPEHDASQFTLAMCLSSSGQVDEALERLQRLTRGPGGAAFRRREPALARVAEAEAVRLRARLLESLVDTSAPPEAPVPHEARVAEAGYA